jgi:hypothetical protein
MIVDHIDRLDTDDRTTIFEMTLCDPFAGELARLYLERFPLYRGSADAGLLELICWLILAREACGIEGVGHA